MQIQIDEKNSHGKRNRVSVWFIYIFEFFFFFLVKFCVCVIYHKLPQFYLGNNQVSDTKCTFSVANSSHSQTLFYFCTEDKVYSFILYEWTKLALLVLEEISKNLKCYLLHNVIFKVLITADIFAVQSKL